MVTRGHWNKTNIGNFWKVNIETKNREQVTNYSDNARTNMEILDTNYTKPNIEKVANEQKHLTLQERALLLSVLRANIKAFQGKRGKWTGSPVSFELKEGETPFCAKPFRIPHSLKATMKKEVARLVEEGVLSPIKASEWACPSFAIPKKNKTIRFISDFRGLNKKIKRKPYPLPLMHDIIPSIGKFKYATTVDLIMGYYSMLLNEKAKERCVICLPWGLYQYNVLPMGLIVSADVFQEAMGKLMSDLEKVFVYMDDIIIIGDGTFEEHMKDVREVLERLVDKGLQINPDKSAWAMFQVEYLGYLLNRVGVEPQPMKIQGILDMDTPENQRHVREFIGMVNFYKNMWPKRSAILTPLTNLTGKGTKFVWGEAQDKAFKEMKRQMAKSAMLAFPNFDLPFDLYTDASDYQIGACLIQKKESEFPIGYFARKFNSAQRKYTVTEKELLSIVEGLKHFRTIDVRTSYNGSYRSQKSYVRQFRL